jgi:hypothetical protein
MSEAFQELASQANHSIDTVELLVMANDWTFERLSENELAVEVAGRWCDYRLFFAFHPEAAVIHFSLALDMRVPQPKQADVGALLALVNEKMWLGHFDLWSDDGLPMFRYAVLLRGTRGVAPEQVEELISTALAESDRFYPAFQFVIWGGKTPAEALACSMIDPVGEA